MKESETLQIGWASADLTPDKPVEVSGQFHVRISEGIHDPVTATALALSSGAGDAAAGVVLVSCDLISIPNGLRDAVREHVAEELPGLPSTSIVLNATHSHTAPEVRLSADREKMGGGISTSGMCLDLPAMAPADYVALAAARIAEAVVAAWRRREPGAVAYGLGHAVVGHNRRSVFERGVSRMYGDTSTDDFRHIEGYEDHSVNVLATWNASGDLTGLMVNVPCPSQVSESLFEISADYWHDTRLELRTRLGDGLYVLPQCSAAGDQSPHIQVGKAAETRMWELSGRTQRQEIACRIADAVEGILPAVGKARSAAPTLMHLSEVVPLSRRKLSQADVDEAMAEVPELLAEYERRREELKAKPELRSTPRWYEEITRCYRRMMWCRGVANRFEIEKTSPALPVELHVIRLGDVAIATNPFEYYLDYGICIKARSPAIQTFVVQLAGTGTYVPSERAVAGKSYGTVPASTPVGPEGGRELAEWTTDAIRRLWDVGRGETAASGSPAQSGRATEEKGGRS